MVHSHSPWLSALPSCGVCIKDLSGLWAIRLWMQTISTMGEVMSPNEEYGNIPLGELGDPLPSGIVGYFQNWVTHDQRRILNARAHISPELFSAMSRETAALNNEDNNWLGLDTGLRINRQPKCGNVALVVDKEMTRGAYKLVHITPPGEPS